MDDKKCEYLNTNFALGSYVCLWEQKPIWDIEYCKTCKNNTERKENNNG